MAEKKEKAVYELIINGELAGKTLKDLEGSLRSVRAQAKLTTDPAEFERLSKAYQNINRKIVAHNDALKGTGGMWSKIKTEVKQFGMIAASYLGFQFITGQIRNVISQNAKLSDSLANVRKTTQMTEEEVRELNSELKEIDTRTSRSELLKLATEAGKLGNESVNDVKKFVKEADMIKVALGEDLGSDAIIKIAKLSKIFQAEMLNIGSAVNTVGQKSEASEQYQVDFLSRVAGISQTAKLAAADMLGFGAALEINGQTAEVSGTAINAFMIDFIKKADEFGQIAGFARGELSKLMSEKGTNAAFIEFLTKLKEGSPSAQSMLNKLQQLGVDGTRGAGVLLTLANNIELVKTQQLIANDAFAKGTSIIDEFNTKNDNFAAVMDKISKKVASWFMNTGAISGLEAGMRKFLDLIDDTTVGDNLTNQWRKQKLEVENLEKTIVPLIDRHDELKSKTNLNGEEQAELNTIIKTISETIPGSITMFDKYGKALEVNSGFAKQFATNQRLVLEQMNVDALSAQRQELFDLRKEIEQYQSLLVSLQKSSVDYSKKAENAKQGGDTKGAVQFIGMVEQIGNEITKFSNKIADARKAIAGKEGFINELLGDPDYYSNEFSKALAKAEKEAKEASDRAEKDKAERDAAAALEESKRLEAEKMAKEYHSNTNKFRQELAQLRAEAIKDEMQREIALSELKYENEKKHIQQSIADKNVKSALLEQLHKEHLDNIDKIEREHRDKRVKTEMQQDLNNLENWYKAEQLALKTSLANQAIDQGAFELKSLELQSQYLAWKIKNLKDYNQSTVDLEIELQDTLAKFHEKFFRENEKYFEKLSDAQKQEVKALIASLSVALVSGLSEAGESVKQILEKIKLIFSSVSEGEGSGEGQPQWMTNLQEFIGKYLDEFSQFADSVSSIWGNLNAKQDNLDKKRLAQIDKNYDQQRSSFDRLLKRKAISQTDYENQMEKLEEERERQKRKIMREQAIRHRKAAIFNATVDAIKGIASVIAEYGWPLGVIFGALQAVALYTQIDAIKSEPLPELSKGKLFTGIGKHPVSKQEVQDPAGNRFLVEENETLLSAATRSNNPELVDALLNASLYNDGRLDENFSFPYIKDQYPQVNTSRVLDTIRQERYFTYTNSTSSAQDAKAIVNRDTASGSAQASKISDDPEFREFMQLNIAFLKHLTENGVEGRIDYKSYKKDVSRMDKITGGKVY